MGRTRAYDEDAVLTAAGQVFRKKGYARVSIRDVEAATGLKAGSVYNSYGNKAGLFRAALKHYNQRIVRGRIARYAPAEAGLEGLRKLFTTLLHESNATVDGCLITNSAIEFGSKRALAGSGVAEGLRLLLDAFAECLEAASKAHVLRAGIDPGRAAVALLAFYQGILVLVRAGFDRKILRSTIDEEINQLKESR